MKYKKMIQWSVQGDGGSDDGCGAQPKPCNEGYSGDGYCDGVNNNEECGFDGGDCCQESPHEYWDDYCDGDECNCLENPEPEDIWPAKKCKKKKKKCHTLEVRKNCMKTCGPCEDELPKKKCKKAKPGSKKCKKGKLAKKCLASCGICEAAGY